MGPAISKLEYFKILATCFGYNEPSSRQKENKVLVHSMSAPSLNLPGFHSVFWPDDGSL
jgi:hypothetical protein